jgi:hypothetical protein
MIKETRQLHKEEKTMTIAEQIATRFGNDGMQWEDKDGQNLADVCLEEARYHEQDWDKHLDRYEFADGTAIVLGESGWDIEGKVKWGWAGVDGPKITPTR